MTGVKTIAFNRFGLGARPGDTIGGDPRGWVAEQLGRFVPAPPTIAAQPSRAELVARFREYREMVQAARAGQSEAPAMGESMTPDMPDGMEAGPKPGNRRAAIRRLAGMRSIYVSAVNARLASAVTTDAPFAETWSTSGPTISRCPPTSRRSSRSRETTNSKRSART